jgi:hypothetical protein
MRFYSDPNSNKALVWFRAFLWIMPTAFLVVSYVGAMWLEKSRLLSHQPSGLKLFGFWAFNAVLIFGTGWFRASLHPGWDKRDRFREMIIFSFSQIVVIPLMFIGITVIEYLYVLV